MSVDRLEHVNIRCRNLEAARSFYALLGLVAGPRPPFASTGYWMYLGDEPVVHLVQRASDEPARTDAGNLDHVAFRGADLDGTRATLSGAGLAFREKTVPHDGTKQVFVQDPDGVQIEINFPPD